jgi:hypothetical protein
MRTATTNTRRLAAASAIASLCLLLFAGSSSAATGPIWHLEPVANTTAAQGSTQHFYVTMRNFGDTATSGQYTLTASLPEGMTAVSTVNKPSGSSALQCSGDGPGGEVLGAATVSCSSEFPAESASYRHTLNLAVAVNPAAQGEPVVHFELSGGGAPTVQSADLTEIAASPRGFGLDAFDAQVSADAAGDPFTQAAGNPYSAATEFELNTFHDPTPTYGDATPVEPLKDIAVELPPGFLGNPQAAAECTAAQLANAVSAGDVRPLCPPGSQVGVVMVREANEGQIHKTFGPLPLDNMVPPPGVAARFGFNIAGTVVVLDARVRSGGDYGITVESTHTSEGLPVAGTTVELWGVPADEAHRSQRACPGEHGPFDSGPTCSAELPAPKAFVRNSTSCEAESTGLATVAHVDSWDHPGARDSEGNPDLSDPAWSSLSSVSHLPPGYPFPPSEWGDPQGPTGCDQVPFTPSITVQPTTDRADSPTGLDVDLTMPQAALTEPGAIAQADVKDSFVTQPVGTRVNPAAAAGLTGCSAAQIGYIGPGPMPNPTRFTNAPPTCPDSSKIGTVEIESPLMSETLEGSIYQARQDENPFGSTLAFYTVASAANGVMIKLPAEVRTDPQTGQVTTVFRNSPQLPFEHYKLHFFGGPHAPLITPPTCGTFTTHSTFTGWANPEDAVHLADSFQIAAGANGSPCPNGEGGRPFNPSFEAGTVNPLAGAFTPFVLKVSREDGSQELSGIETTLPPGLIGKLAGIPYCPEAAIGAAALARGVFEQASPSCPAASLLGVSDASAGAGPEPFHNPGKVYLAGPYKGAPLSLAILTPAVAGPLDLGTVVVRAALHVDPETTQVHVVSDPIPSVIREGGNGFPLDVRQVLVQINRPDFTLNPTSCDPMSVDGTISALQGASAKVSNRFQVGNCDKLRFKPRLSLRLKGKTRRGGNPALRATLRMPAGGANIARVSVALPHSEFLDQSHIKTICTRVQYAAGAGGGAKCPPGSVYGHATAYSPLLDQPLSGPVYLRSSSHELPDLVASLDGQIHVDLAGTIDSVHGGIRNRFEIVPDAPVTKFVLTTKGGKKGLLENSRNLCDGANRATAKFDGQNGKTHDFRPVLKVDCAKTATS